ncbi:hypothetical protein [Phycobacter sp. K97]|uniref:hypothetical protein n=1 Tax=Phycobacter sedimenti TaxID=3133977 RepID=UPI00311EF58C
MTRLPARFCLRLLTVLAFTITMVTVGFGHQRVTAQEATLPAEMIAIYGEAAADFCGEFSDTGEASASCPLCRLVDAAMMPEPLCLYRDMEYVALPDQVAEAAVLPQLNTQTSHAPRAPPAA